MGEEWSRTTLLLGEKAMEKLKNSHVAVFGLGGVGSYVTEALARAGVGKLTLVDKDVVSLSNVNRQLYALHSTLGKEKTLVAKERVLDINPECDVETLNLFYLPETGEAFFQNRKPDYIIDAIDIISGKIDLICRAKEMGIPIISAMGAGNKLHPEHFKIADIYSTTICPLARVMRRELKRRNIDAVPVVYSTEKPLKNDGVRGDGVKVAPASISFVPPVAGFLLASKVIEDLMGKIAKDDEQ